MTADYPMGESGGAGFPDLEEADAGATPSAQPAVINRVFEGQLRWLADEARSLPEFRGREAEILGLRRELEELQRRCREILNRLDDEERRLREDIWGWCQNRLEMAERASV
jgi:hypothetical protein